MTEIKADKEQILKLRELQTIDSEMFDVNSQLEEFPQKIKEMDDSLNLKTEGMKNAEDALKMLQVQKNEKEVEMKASEEKIAKHDGELYQIKNNNEYQALQKEIDSIKADVSIMEEEIINFFDEIEAAKKSLEDEKTKFATEKQQTEKEKQQISSEKRAIAEKIKVLEANRETILSEVRPEILSIYNRILENKGRVALADIQGECCGACNLQLRPQILDDAKLKKTIVLCENCSRILYAED